MIEDIELRDIYKVSSAEHLQNLETGLLELEKNPDNEGLIQNLFREAHSLKGDSRVTGVRTVETIAHRVEELLGQVKNHERPLTPELGDRLYNSLDGMKKLVHEAITDEPSGVDATEILNKLTEGLNGGVSVGNGHGNVILPQITSRFIEDEDLREIYKISSGEHLEKLQSGLQLLEKHPEDVSSLEDLLQEAQSFETDSRIIGREDLETVIHKVEEILEGIKSHQINFTQVSQRLNEGIKGIKELVNEAITGNPAKVDPQQLFNQLQSPLAVTVSQPIATPQPTTEKTQETATPATSLDTIRVSMRHLDALLTHTGELTVTRTRMAYATEQISQLAGLWDEWKTYQKGKSSKVENTVVSTKLRQCEERLHGIIDYLKAETPENYTRLDLISRELDEKIRTLRLLPLSTVFLIFPRVVRDLAKEQGKEIEFVVEGGEITVDKQIIEEIKDPLMHLIRNAVDHGIEAPEERRQLGKSPQGTIILRATQTTSNIIIEVKDDGRGLDENVIKQTAVKRKIRRPEELALMTSEQVKQLIFTPGFSTRSFITEISGRGVGLDVVRNNIERLKGNIELFSEKNDGCRFRFQLRSTLSSLSVMLVEVQGLVHAIPLDYVDTTLLIKPDEIYTLEGRPTISIMGEPVSVVKMIDMLELPLIEVVNTQKKRSGKAQKFLGCVVLKVGNQRLGVLVDTLLQVLDVVIKPQTKMLKRVRNVAGSTILGTGDVCIILNPPDIIKSFQKAYLNAVESGLIEEEETTQVTVKPVILLAEDSIAVRTQEKRILEKAGYEVVIAVDGLDGYNKLKTRAFDAIISDVEMPNMNGFEFVAKVRQQPEYQELPIILVTSLAKDEHKRRGAQVGANAYIVKDQFNQEMLVETLDRLV